MAHGQHKWATNSLPVHKAFSLPGHLEGNLIQPGDLISVYSQGMNHRCPTTPGTPQVQLLTIQVPPFAPGASKRLPLLLDPTFGNLQPIRRTTPDGYPFASHLAEQRCRDLFHCNTSFACLQQFLVDLIAPHNSTREEKCSAMGLPYSYQAGLVDCL